jgi:aminopeptidase
VIDASDPRVGQMARVIVERMLEIRDGDAFYVAGAAIAAPLFERVAALAAARGAHVHVAAMPEGVEHAILASSSEQTLAREDRIAHALVRTADARLRISAAWEVGELADIPPEIHAARRVGSSPVMETSFRRAAAGELRWAVAMHPTPALAAEAGMEPEAFADLVYRAAKCDEEDPIAAWTLQGERQERLQTLLAAGETLRIRGPGTDLALGIGGRTWRSSDAARNLPDGEVFTGPHETAVDGHVRFTYPGLRGGRRIEGIRLRFEKGVVVEASAEKEEAALHAVLDLDEGARRLGELGIGTNYGLDRWCANTLLDEKIGGTFHLAVGRGYPETGSQNVSAVHWDMVCDLREGGELELDGRVIQRDGRFLPELGLGL